MTSAARKSLIVGNKWRLRGDQALERPVYRLFCYAMAWRHLRRL